MDELVRVFHGGMVKENGEFENMVEDIELFDSPPLLKDLVDRVISKHSCGIDEISLRGRFDCGKDRAHYVLMTLESRYLFLCVMHSLYSCLSCTMKHMNLVDLALFVCLMHYM